MYWSTVDSYDELMVGKSSSTSDKVGFVQMEMIPLPATFGHVPHCANCSERPRHREVWVSRSFKNVDYGLEMV